jgi:hypothetical protein
MTGCAYKQCFVKVSRVQFSICLHLRKWLSCGFLSGNFDEENFKCGPITCEAYKLPMRHSHSMNNCSNCNVVLLACR